MDSLSSRLQGSCLSLQVAPCALSPVKDKLLTGKLWEMYMGQESKTYRKAAMSNSAVTYISTLRMTFYFNFIDILFKILVTWSFLYPFTYTGIYWEIIQS